LWRWVTLEEALIVPDGIRVHSDSDDCGSFLSLGGWLSSKDGSTNSFAFGGCSFKSAPADYLSLEIILVRQAFVFSLISGI
jgi:hypothetical protein